MGEPLSPKQVERLLPALRDVAELVQRRGDVSEEDLKLLSQGVGLRTKWAVRELRIWAGILAEVRGAHDAHKRDIAVRALRLRGIQEASARLAVEIVAPEPPPSPSAPIRVSSEAIAFGELAPGQGAHATLIVSGGPGRVRVGSDLLLVEPTTFGPAETELKVTVKGGREGEILWDTVILESDRERVEVEVSARWSAPSVAEEVEPRIVPALSLRGFFISSDLREQGCERRLGRGFVCEVIALDEARVLVVDTGGAGLFDVGSGEALWEIWCFAQCGAISSHGNLLALGSEGEVVIWDLQTGCEVRRMEHGAWVSGVSFSPDGRFLASGGGDGVVRVWDIESGREVRRMEHGAWVESVSFSPDGRFLASGGRDGVVRVWEVGSGREVRRMEHGAWVVNEREFQSGRTVFGVGGCGWCGSDVGGREWA
jgi:hypothetical protein